MGDRKVFSPFKSIRISLLPIGTRAKRPFFPSFWSSLHLTWLIGCRWVISFEGRSPPGLLRTGILRGHDCTIFAMSRIRHKSL